MEEIKFLWQPSKMKKEDTNGKTSFNANVNAGNWFGDLNLVITSYLE